MIGLEKPGKISVSGLVRWIFGLIFIFISIGGIAIRDYISSSFLTLAAILLIPPISRSVENRLNFKISGMMLFVAVFCLLIAFAAALPQAEKSDASGDSGDVANAQVTEGRNDVSVAEKAVQQVGETDLTENKVRAEEMASNQDRGFAKNTPEDSNLAASNLANHVKPTNGNLTVNFLDVGQGDSILLEHNGKAMLIDAGEQNQGAKVSAYLLEHNISSIDYVIATHPHSDHIGGMDEILNGFQVEHFIDSGFPYTSKTYENMLTTIDEKNISFEVAKKGEEIEFDPAIEVKVLNPGSEYSNELNENSVVLKVNYGEVSFLLMGDAGLETEGKIMTAGYDLDSDILKVGHHASLSGSGETFVSAVSPEVSVIEVGAGNNYGHPTAEILERLQKGSRVYRTDLDGTIVVTTDGSTYTVTAQKTGSGEKELKTRPSDSGDDSGDDSGADSSAVSMIPEGAESEPGESGVSSSAESMIYVSDLSPQDEWVAISNKGSSPISLKGWKIEDDGSKHTYTFPSYILDSQTTVTLHTGEGMDKATEIYWGSGSPIWNNDGDTAYLYDNSGKLVDTLER